MLNSRDDIIQHLINGGASIEEAAEIAVLYHEVETEVAEVMHLSKADSLLLARTLLEPPEPSENLRKLMTNGVDRLDHLPNVIALSAKEVHE